MLTSRTPTGSLEYNNKYTVWGALILKHPIELLLYFSNSIPN